MDELPFAIGALNLTTEQFERLTPREYRAKRKGFTEYERNKTIQQSWLIGAMVGRAMGASEKNPYPTLEELMGNKTQTETDEELFEKAAENGIDIPEGVL